MNTNRSVVGAVLALLCTAAGAGTIQVGGTQAGPDGKITSKTPGICTVNFNNGTAANTCGATYTQDGGQPLAASHLRSGMGTAYATPAGDSTTFLTLGPTDGAAVTVMLAMNANYFGFFAGSLDSFNLVQFYLNGVLVDSFTGAQINAVAFPGDPTNGNQAASQFIDYFPGSFYNSLVLSSTGDAFETDNHAFGVAMPTSVPEPTSIALIGLGGIALGLRRRRTRTG